MPKGKRHPWEYRSIMCDLQGFSMNPEDHLRVQPGTADHEVVFISLSFGVIGHPTVYLIGVRGPRTSPRLPDTPFQKAPAIWWGELWKGIVFDPASRGVTASGTLPILVGWDGLTDV